MKSKYQFQMSEIASISKGLYTRGLVVFLAALLYGVPSIGQAAPGNGLAQRVADLEVEIAAMQALFSVDEDGNLTIAAGGDLVLDAGIGREVVVEKKAMMLNDATVMGETVMDGDATVMGEIMMMDDATVMGATELEGSTMMMRGATVDGGQLDALQDVTVTGFLNLPASGVAEAKMYAVVADFPDETDSDTEVVASCNSGDAAIGGGVTIEPLPTMGSTKVEVKREDELPDGSSALLEDFSVEIDADFQLDGKTVRVVVVCVALG